MSYSIDFRSRVVDYVIEGGNKNEACAIFKISLPTLNKWIKKFYSGSLADTKPRRPWKKINADKLLEYVNKNPNLTLKHYAEVFNVKSSSMCNAFKVLKITRKKRVHYTKSEMNKNVKYFWQVSRMSQKKI